MKELENDMFTFFKKMWLRKGLDELSASIIATLLTEPDDITMEYLMKKTGYSLASVSNKVKMLTNFGMIIRKTKPGAKKIYLHMEKNFFKLMKEAMVKGEGFLKSGKTELAELVKKYKGKTGNERERKQMKNLLAIHNYLAKIEPIFMDFKRKLEAIK